MSAVEVDRNIQKSLKGRKDALLTFTYCAGEKNLLTRFLELIRQFQPDILATYNGNGYDWPFLFSRCRAHGLHVSLSLLENVFSFSKKKTFDSAAAGQRDSYEIVSFAEKDPFWRDGQLKWGHMSGIPGCLCIDMYDVVKNNYKFSSYKLDDVAKELLSGDDSGKVQLSYGEQRRLYLTEACSQDQEGAPRTPDCVSKAILKIVLYVAQDAHLVQDLLDATLTVPKTLAMASVTSTSLQAVLDRGQQIKVYNTLLRTAHAQGRVANNGLPIEDRLQEVPGATVLAPDIGFHGPTVAQFMPELQSLPQAQMDAIRDVHIFSCVQVWDFMSLYPSIMITFLLCYSNFKGAGATYDILKGMLVADPEGAEEEEVTYLDYLECFEKDTDCVLPALELRLFQDRKAYKKKMKEAYKDGKVDLYNALNAAQLAVKVVMNSGYGFTGVLGGRGMYAEPMIAATTTACGRDIIAMTKAWALERSVFEIATDQGTRSVLVTPDISEWARIGHQNPETSGYDFVFLIHVVYGDTDSIMPKLSAFVSDLPNELLEAVGTHCANQITERFTRLFKDMGYPNPMIVLEYEKLYRGYMLDKKKRYAGLKVEPGKPPILSSSGLLTARRDNAKLARTLYGGLLNDLIVDKDMLKAMTRIRSTLRAILDKTLPLEEYVYTTQVRRRYVNPTVLGAQLKLRGAEQGISIESGQRVAYYYGKSSKILAGKGEKAELYLNDSPRRSQSKPCAYSMIAVLEKPIMGLLNHFRTQPGMKYDTMLSLFLSSKKQAKAQSQGNGSLSGFVTLGKRKRE